MISTTGSISKRNGNKIGLRITGQVTISSHCFASFSGLLNVNENAALPDHRKKLDVQGVSQYSQRNLSERGSSHEPVRICFCIDCEHRESCPHDRRIRSEVQGRVAGGIFIQLTRRLSLMDKRFSFYQKEGYHLPVAQDMPHELFGSEMTEGGSIRA